MEAVGPVWEAEYLAELARQLDSYCFEQQLPLPMLHSVNWPEHLYRLRMLCQKQSHKLKVM